MTASRRASKREPPSLPERMLDMLERLRARIGPHLTADGALHAEADALIEEARRELRPARKEKRG